MSDEQEMQFADPAWQPKVTREFDTRAPDPAPTGTGSSSADAATFQAPTGEADYEDYAQGYRQRDTPPSGRNGPSQNPPSPDPQSTSGNQQAPFSQTQQPWYQRLPIWAWWLIGALVLSSIVQSIFSQSSPIGSLFDLLFLGALAFGGWLIWTRRVRISLAGETQAAGTHTFTVSAHPTIILKNQVGSISLRAGQENQVRVTTTRRGYLFNQRLDKETPVLYSQDSGKNTVTVRSGNWRPFGKNAINFEVTVPPQADLQLSTTFGTIVVQNISGRMTLRTSAGTIEATQVTLQGKSRLKGDAGSIVFSGSLDPSGKYEITTDLGSITATLPANISCALDAKTDLGSVTTNLPLIQQQRNRVSGTIGSGSQPRLKLKTDLGSISVQRR